MIASVFSKTRPFNYLVIGILSLFFFSIKIITLVKPNADWIYYAEEFGLYLLLFASLFILNFITLKNGLTKGNNYALFLFDSVSYDYYDMLDTIEYKYLGNPMLVN